MATISRQTRYKPPGPQSSDRRDSVSKAPPVTPPRQKRPCSPQTPSTSTRSPIGQSPQRQQRARPSYLTKNFVHVLCGKAFKYKDQVKDHHFGRKEGFGCYNRCGAPPGVKWNDHPSCWDKHKRIESGLPPLPSGSATPLKYDSDGNPYFPPPLTRPVGRKAQPRRSSRSASAVSVRSSAYPVEPIPLKMFPSRSQSPGSLKAPSYAVQPIAMKPFERTPTDAMSRGLLAYTQSKPFPHLPSLGSGSQVSARDDVGQQTGEQNKFAYPSAMHVSSTGFPLQTAWQATGQAPASGADQGVTYHPNQPRSLNSSEPPWYFHGRVQYGNGITREAQYPVGMRSSDRRVPPFHSLGNREQVGMVTTTGFLQPEVRVNPMTHGVIDPEILQATNSVPHQRPSCSTALNPNHSLAWYSQLTEAAAPSFTMENPSDPYGCYNNSSYENCAEMAVFPGLPGLASLSLPSPYINPQQRPPQTHYLDSQPSGSGFDENWHLAHQRSVNGIPRLLSTSVSNGYDPTNTNGGQVTHGMSLNHGMSVSNSMSVSNGMSTSGIPASNGAGVPLEHNSFPQSKANLTHGQHISITNEQFIDAVLDKFTRELITDTGDDPARQEEVLKNMIAFLGEVGGEEEAVKELEAGLESIRAKQRDGSGEQFGLTGHAPAAQADAETEAGEYDPTKSVCVWM